MSRFRLPNIVNNSLEENNSNELVIDLEEEQAKSVKNTDKKSAPVPKPDPNSDKSERKSRSSEESATPPTPMDKGNDKKTEKGKEVEKQSRKT